MKFAISMIWREQRDHSTDCYFCLTSIKGYSMKTRHNIIYSTVDSDIRHLSYCSELPIPNYPIVSDVASFSIDTEALSSEDERLEDVAHQNEDCFQKKWLA